MSEENMKRMYNHFVSQGSILAAEKILQTYPQFEKEEPKPEPEPVEEEPPKKKKVKKKA